MRAAFLIAAAAAGCIPPVEHKNTEAENGAGASAPNASSNQASSGAGGNFVCSDPGQCGQLCNGLVSRWSFDEGSGSVAHDSVGHNDAVLNGATWASAAACHVGGCVQFNGGQSVQVTTFGTPLPAGNQPRTLALWFKTARSPGQSSADQPLAQWGSGAPQQLFLLELTPHSPGLVFSGGEAQGATVVMQDIWYHSAVSYDGVFVKVYLDGQVDAGQGVVLNTVLDLNVGFTIGWDPFHNDHWIGAIDEVEIYNRALSANEIQMLVAGCPAPCCGK